LIAPTSSYNQNTIAIAAATNHPIANAPLAGASFIVNNVIYCENSPHCIVGNVCGNGVQDGGEQCDDDNDVSGDGCSHTCQIEAGFHCTDMPSQCFT